MIYLEPDRVNEISWTWIEGKLEQLASLGMKHVHVSKVQPWELADNVEFAGTCRLHFETNIRASFVHSSGVTVHWSMELEEPDSDGAPDIRFATDRIREVAARMKPDVRKAFCALMAINAKKLCEHARKAVVQYNRQMKASEELIRLIGLCDKPKAVPA